MNSKSRQLNSIINSSIGMISQVVIMLGQFILQTVFIKTLGAEYLGLNGLFSNILQFLSLAELGIGTAITFTLFKPIAEKDSDQIVLIMRLYKNIYISIGLIVLTGGLILSLFVNDFVSTGTTIDSVQVLFILYLLNSVVSYFFAYRRTLLIADQKSYVDTSNQALFRVLQVVLQILFLSITHNYVVYLVIQIILTLASNFSIYVKTNRLYPFLKNNDVYGAVPQEIVMHLKKNVVGAMSSKIGSVVMYGTDNILLSKFIGLNTVGVYTNYMLVVNSLNGLAMQVFNPVAASIANFVNGESDKDLNRILFLYMYVVNFIVLFISFELSMLLTPFIHFWIGGRYVFDQITVNLLLINWMVNTMRITIQSFMNAFGTYWEVRWKSIIESLVNLVVGIILITTTNLGVNAVIIGSLSSNILINAWYEPLILFTKVPELKSSRYVLNYLGYITVGITGVIALSFIGRRVDNGLITILLVGVAIAILFVIGFMIVTYKMREAGYFREIVLIRLRKIIKLN